MCPKPRSRRRNDAKGGEALKTISFQCKNKDSEIAGIVICILLFLAGWMASAAIARAFGDSLPVTVAIPVLFLVCGVVYMSGKNKTPMENGTAQFSDSGRVRMCFGGRSVIFDCKDVKQVYYTRDTLTNDPLGNGYVMVIRLPFRCYRIFSQEPAQGETGFENTELYAVYLELKDRMNGNEKE